MGDGDGAFGSSTKTGMEGPSKENKHFGGVLNSIYKQCSTTECYYWGVLVVRVFDLISDLALVLASTLGRKTKFDECFQT